MSLKLKFKGNLKLNDTEEVREEALPGVTFRPRDNGRSLRRRRSARNFKYLRNFIRGTTKHDNKCTIPRPGRQIMAVITPRICRWCLVNGTYRDAQTAAAAAGGGEGGIKGNLRSFGRN